MKILIPSVKYSGASILINQMMNSYPVSTLKSPEDGIVQDHVIYTKMDDLLYLASKSDFIVIPVRHPKVVAKLWLDNGEEISEDMFQMFHSIVEFQSLDNVIFIPMDVDDLFDRVKKIKSVEINPKPRLSISQSAEMALRAYNIKYEDLFEVESRVRNERGVLRAIKAPVGDKLQELCDDIQGFLDDVYGCDPEVKPDRKLKEKKRVNKKASAPKNSWKHECIKTGENAYTPKGQICVDCGGEE
tara:strand:- start:16374 stop:17105 length:732 start_codon:yes stop_codon:yes gene_type:complete